MRNQILLFSLLLTITSCTEYLLYYQTYTVESELEQNEGSLKYENEDCALYYNLWAEYGNPGFVMENKTDSDLFVLMYSSFFIHICVAYDYYANREITESYTSTYEESISIDGKAIYPYYSFFNPIDATKKVGYGTNHVSSITVKEQPVICIPPHSAKYIPVRYPISDGNRLYHDGSVSPEQSPYIFTNRISYKSNNEDSIKHVENEFWVSNIEQIKPHIGFPDKSVKREKKENVLADEKNPNKFYIKYYEKNSLF